MQSLDEMKMENKTAIWDALCRTDPAHTKGFQRAGGFRGTAIKPIYCIQRMTQIFGACGEGWGMDKPEFQLVPAGNEILVYCTVRLWYVSPHMGVYGVGGDKVLVGGEKPRSNDEAFKMAYTDALSNAMKQIGMAADVHMGLFEDNKYLAEVAKEFAPEPEVKPAFRTAGERRKFCKNVLDGINTSETEDDLKALYKDCATTLTAMQRGSEEDVVGYQEIMKQFSARKTLVNNVAMQAAEFGGTGYTQPM